MLYKKLETHNTLELRLQNCCKIYCQSDKKNLPSIINSDQTGFLKNRFIGENIRLLNYIINYTEKEELPGLLLFIDFEKAFDTIEWPFIEKTLKYYNFGDSLTSWIKLFYTDISSRIQNNGWSSDFFLLTTGVRQGCPLSPYLFLLCAEILGAAVRRDDEVKGIQTYGKECKVSQYADDTTLILNGSLSSVERSFSLLDAFALMSGLKVNYAKTEALWIGTSKNRTDKLLIKQNIKSGGAGSGAWTRGSMIAREKKFGRVRLSTNALKINMEDVPSIVTFENLSWSSSVNRLLLLFVLALVNLDLLWMESQTSWMGSLTAVSTCSHLMENLPKGFYWQALVL